MTVSGNCPWEEIRSFRSPGEYARFVKWLEEQVEEGLSQELLAADERNRTAFDDRRFVWISSEEVWELKIPDPGYFQGSWSKVGAT